MPVQKPGIFLEGFEEQMAQGCQCPDQSHYHASYLTRRMYSLRQQVEETTTWLDFVA